MHLKGHDYRITASIGITLYRGNSEDCDTILKHADNAMYQAKADGRNSFRLYQSEMNEAADKGLSTERKLHQAINNEEFTLHYQPKFDQSRKIVSAEVLIRWQKPGGNLVPPSEFIQVAEGVETEEQLKMLINYDCQMLQGYLLSKPVDIDAFTDLLKPQTLYLQELNQRAKL